MRPREADLSWQTVLLLIKNMYNFVQGSCECTLMHQGSNMTISSTHMFLSVHIL